jgi:hypothetical protein
VGDEGAGDATAEDDWWYRGEEGGPADDDDDDCCWCWWLGSLPARDMEEHVEAPDDQTGRGVLERRTGKSRHQPESQQRTVG